VLLGLHFFHVVMGRLPEWNEVAGPVAGLFGKSADLTGRTDIWDLVLLEAGKHPWAGIGYGAFWLGMESPSQYIIDALYWIPLQAHNGYLDVYNELGVIGIAILSGFLIVHTVNLVRLLRVDR